MRTLVSTNDRPSKHLSLVNPNVPLPRASANDVFENSRGPDSTASRPHNLLS